MSTINPYEILPVKPYFTLKQVKKARKKIFRYYYPTLSKKTNNDILNDKIKEKYNELATLINSFVSDFEDGNASLSQTTYDIYVDDFEFECEEYSKEELEIILNANALETSGNKIDLERRVVENIPSKVAEINIWEHNELKDIYKTNLESLKLYQLKQLLETKGKNTSGTKKELINRIIFEFSEDEINRFVEEIQDKTYENRKNLNSLNLKQLKQILSNNNLNSSGNKKQLVDRILEKIHYNEIERNIKEVSVNVKKALETLNEITSKQEFKEKLKEYGLEEIHGKEIKKELEDLINNYKISEKNVEIELEKRLKDKSKELEEEALDEMYRLVGRDKHNSKYLKQLEKAELSENVGYKIKKEIIASIKAKEVNKENIPYLLNLKINEAEKQVIEEKFTLLYDFIGEKEPNEELKELLDENNLTDSTWEKIKKEISGLIKSKKIRKNEIIPIANKILNTDILNYELNTNETPVLNQVAILNNFNTSDDKEEQINIIIENLSDTITVYSIKDNVKEIKDIESTLKSFYKMQLEYIVEKNNLNKTGTKNELIDRILSHLHLNLIELYIKDIDNVIEKLNKTTLNYLSFIVKDNKIKAKGTKPTIIKEIIKNVSLTQIKESFKQIDETNDKLNGLSQNELKYIIKTNQLTIYDDSSILVREIQENVQLHKIKENINEIDYIKDVAKSFNDIQRKHILLTNNLDFTEDKENQIEQILDNVDLTEIPTFDIRFKTIEKDLKSFNTNQLKYILEQNELEITLKKEKQINTILENLVLPQIESNIRILKSLEEKLNKLNNAQFSKLLKINRIKEESDREKTISKIMSTVPIKTILNNLEYMEDTYYISPVKIIDGKTGLNPVKYKNQRVLILFEDEGTYENFVKKSYKGNQNIHKLKKDFEYYAEIVRNNDFDGILLKDEEGNNELIKKEDLEK